MGYFDGIDLHSTSPGSCAKLKRQWILSAGFHAGRVDQGHSIKFQVGKVYPYTLVIGGLIVIGEVYFTVLLMRWVQDQSFTDGWVSPTLYYLSIVPKQRLG